MIRSTQEMVNLLKTSIKMPMYLLMDFQLTPNFKVDSSTRPTRLNLNGYWFKDQDQSKK
jgi:hypothetical protein